MEFDEVYDYIGHFGWYQLLYYLMVGFIAMGHGYQVSAMIFVGLDQDHFCQVDQLANFSYEQQQNIAIPMDGDSYSRCDVYDLPWDTYDDSFLVNWNRTVMTANANITQCNKWNYIQDVFGSTVVSQFDLVCGRGWLIQMASTTYIGGMMLASFASGILSDRFGRLKITVLGTFLHPVFGLAVAYSPSMEVFCVFRFFVGLTAFTAYLGGYIMLAEAVGKKYRTYANISFNTTFTLGIIVYTLEAYFVRDHQLLQLVMAIPAFATITYFWALPESARWLYTKGRTEESMKIIRVAAAVNRKELPKDFKLTEKEKPQPGQQRGVLDLFRYSVFRKRTLLNFNIWFSNSLIYFGIGLNVGALVGDIYLNAFLTYLADFPANAIAAFMSERYGRRKVLCAAFVVGSLANLAAVPVLVTAETEWVLVALTVLGRAGASAAFCTTFLMTAELYPTEIRHIALGSCSTCSRIAGMLAPYIGSPLASIWTPMPQLIFGVFGVSSAICVMLLPETRNKPLPDKVEDVLRLEKAKKTGEETSQVSSSGVQETDLDKKNAAVLDFGHTNMAMDENNISEESNGYISQETNTHSTDEKNGQIPDYGTLTKF